MKNKIMVLDKIEDLLDNDGELIGKLVFDKAGNQLKVKKGQGGKLADRWDELEVGKGYTFKMGEFKGYPFVKDFELVENVFALKAQEEVEDKQISTKNKSVCLSYAKDIGIAREWSVITILETADIFYAWLQTGQIRDESIVKPEVDKPQIEKQPEEPKVTNPKELMAWAVSHGREFTPSWVRKELGWGMALITDEKAQEGYEALKVAMSW